MYTRKTDTKLYTLDSRQFRVFLSRLFRGPQKGISIIEALLAVAVFVVGTAAITLMYINSVVAAFNSLEETRAIFLAQEGLEAVKSIRDNRFADLIIGTHGLILSGGRWTTTTTPETVLGFTRTITIIADTPDSRIVRSRVSWQDPFLRRENFVEFTENLSNIWGR